MDPFLSIQSSPISFTDSLTNKCKKESKKNSHSVYLTNTINSQNITLGTTSKNGGLMTSFYLKRFSKSIIGPCSSFFSEVVVVFLFVFFPKLRNSLLHNEITTSPTSSLSKGSLGSTAVGVQILMS